MDSDKSLFGRVEAAMKKLAMTLALTSGLLLLISVIITSVSIIGRMAIPLGLAPVPGDVELVETLVGLAVFGFMPYCQLARGHVGVDLFVMPFGNRAMMFTQTLGDLIIAGLVLLLTWRHYEGTLDKYDSGEISFILGFPTWWGYSAAMVLMVLLSIVTLFTVWRDIRDIAKGNVLHIEAGGH